jgi:hypothetical protein
VASALRVSRTRGPNDVFRYVLYRCPTGQEKVQRGLHPHSKWCETHRCELTMVGTVYFARNGGEYLYQKP